MSTILTDAKIQIVVLFIGSGVRKRIYGRRTPEEVNEKPKATGDFGQGSFPIDGFQNLDCFGSDCGNVIFLKL